MITFIKRAVNYFIRKIRKQTEEERLSQLSRYTPTETMFFDKKIKLVDAASYLFTKKEIFDQEIYRFNVNHTAPYILDGGANIGLSVIYFKKLFPEAEIIAFEPDDKVFETLKYNVSSFGFDKVSLEKKALWDMETKLSFFSEGADAGHVAKQTDTNSIVTVESVRLRDYMNKSVDFLKLDIEGAEVKVLRDCSDRLLNVRNLFVEFHSYLHEDQLLDELLAILKKAGFRYVIQQHGVMSKNPFIKIEAQGGMDILLNISAYRN